MSKQLLCCVCQVPCGPASINSVCASTQDGTQRAAWQQPTAAASSAGGIASLPTYPPYIGPVPLPPGVQPPAPSGVPPPVGVPPPRGVPIPTGVPPPATGLAASVRVSLPAGVPLSLGVPAPAAGLLAPGLPTSVRVSLPTGVPLRLGGPPPPGVPPPLGISMPVGGSTFLGGSLHVGGPQPAGIPPPVGISKPVGVLAPLGGPQPSGIPPPVSISTPVGVPALLGGPLPVGGPQYSGVPPPASISNPVGVSVPLGGAPLVGPPLPTVNSRLPPPRFMSSFDPTVPPPAFLPAASSTAVSSVTETPVMQMSRVGEDMDLDNSESSEEDLGEGFDEEWPICSRRISRSHDKSQRSTFMHDEGSQRNEYQNSGSNFHSSELQSMQDKQPVKSNEYFGIGVEQSHISQMFGTSLPAGGNNLAISSAPLDHPRTMASMLAVGGPGLVRNVAPLPQPASMPPAMLRAPGSLDQASGSILRGLSDVDFRISSYGGGTVPVGPLSAPMKMAPPPLPPFAGPLPGTVRPFSESSLPVSNNASAGISSGGFNNPVAGMETPYDVLGPGMRGVGHAGSVGNRPPMLPGVSSVPGPVPAGSGTASAQGMVTGMARGPSDMMSVGPRFINTVPSSTFEPANVRPPGQQIFMQRIVSPNPSTDVGLVRCQIQGGGQAVGRPVGPGSVELSSDMVAGNVRPANAGNVCSLRGLTDFTGVDHTLIPPDSVRFNMQHEMLRVRAPASGSQPSPVQNATQHPAGPPPQIPFPRGNLQGQFRGPSVEQKAPSSGPSERVLNALQSLAGMQTDPQDHPSLASGGITDTRFADIQPADAGIRQMAPGLNKMLFGPQADISGFGPSPVRSLLQQQIRADGGSHSLLRGNLPAPPKISIGQPHLPLPGNIHSLYSV